MKKLILIIAILCLSSCKTTDHRNYADGKSEDTEMIGVDMQHNKCVSKGYAVDTSDYKNCMEISK